MSASTTLSTLVLIPTSLFVLLYFIYYPPTRLFTYMQHRHPLVLFHIPLPPSEKIVALTLDDAPSVYTEKLLDLLKEHKSKATFFIIGNQVQGIAGREELLKRMVAEGHEVGNHALYDEKSVFRGNAALEEQIKTVQSLLPENANGLRYFRPGGGFFNTSMVKHVTAMGYKVVLGCIYPHDPQVWNAEVNARHVLRMVRSGGIIILHDRRGHSVRQLELVLQGLREQGWEITSLGGLLERAEELGIKGGLETGEGVVGVESLEGGEEEEGVKGLAKVAL